MKTYLLIIKHLQRILIWFSVGIMLILPPAIALRPDLISGELSLHLYDASHYVLFFVMLIRPLADILPEVKWIRPLVILRKGTGILSAAIIVSFILSKIIISPLGYFGSWLTIPYWSIANYALLAHLGDISAIILLLTSNSYSKRILGTKWKKIQKLAYVYFYASSLYVFLTFNSTSVVVSMSVVTALTLIAYLKNRARKAAQTVTLTPTTV
jgi:DMSO/TMAO reductase YedYZ heme-binding membrane subunit